MDGEIEATGTDPVVTRLAGARIPADGGLSSLGLLMQLSGTLGLVVWSGFSILAAMLGGPGLIIFLAGLTFLARSSFHRAAGSALLYSRRPAGTVYAYALVGIIHSLGVILVLLRTHPPLQILTEIGAMLLFWPVTVMVVASLPRYRRAFRQGLPLSEDLGFEGAAVLMLVLGVMGVTVPAAALWGLLEAPGFALFSGGSAISLIILAALLIRSLLHARAGWRGTRGTTDERAVNRYVAAAVGTAFLASAAMVLLGLVGGSIGGMVLMSLIVFGLLLAWPLHLRRFIAERHFSLTMDGPQDAVLRRAPDAGLTSLGWLLLAMGLLGLASALPQALFGQVDLRQAVVMMRTVFGDHAAGAVRSPWWEVGVSGLEVWAGVELVRMGRHARIAANIFGVIGALVAVYILWPQFSALDQLLAAGAANGDATFFHSTRVGMLIHVAMALALPVASLILVNRRLPADATARVRT